jgi:hypothetical protein
MAATLCNPTEGRFQGCKSQKYWRDFVRVQVQLPKVVITEDVPQNVLAEHKWMIKDLEIRKNMN